MTKTDGWQDRAAGVLLASAAGNALGAGDESTHPKPGVTIGMVAGGTFNWAAGEWTDDTSMTLAVARVTATSRDWGTVRACGEQLSSTVVASQIWASTGLGAIT